METLRVKLMTLNYTSGSLTEYHSAFPIWLNVLTVIHGIRNSFMVQWIDYIYPESFKEIMESLKNYNHQVHHNRFRFHVIDQGVIVSLKANHDIEVLIQRYRNSESRDEKSYLLGQILSYPASGENLMTDEHFELLNSGKDIPDFEFFSIYAHCQGLEDQTIMVNIYHSKEGLRRLHNFTEILQRFFRKHEPDFLIYSRYNNDDDGNCPISVKVDSSVKDSYIEFIGDLESRLKEENIWNT